MRLTSRQVLLGFQHDDVDVRQHCLSYFTESLSEDNSVMPAVIAAVESMGSDAFKYFQGIERLPQSDTTIEWVIHSLKEDSRFKPKHNHADFREEVLAECRGNLLLRHRDGIVATLRQPKRALAIHRRLESLAKAPEQLWSDLQSLCQKNRSAKYCSKFPMSEAQDLVIALADSGAVPIDEVMRLLQRDVHYQEDKALGWLQPFLVQLLGRIRHEPASTLLLEKLRLEGDFLCDEVHSALVRIGTDQVVDALAERFSQEEWHWQNYACDIFGKIHCEESARRAGALLQLESIPDDIHERFGYGLAGQFSTEGLESVGAFLDSNDEWIGDYEWTETFALMRSACKLMNFSLPRFDSWQQQMDEALAESADDYDDEFDDDGFDDDEFDDEFSEDDFRQTPTATIVHETPLVGRNDPCPCGSGKKFKKCCLGKDPTN